MNRYAQTNLQLYGQLLAAGRPEPELRLVRDAYELALRLFAGHFRGNSKPFLAHLVGVASILAEHGHAIETAAAGLLHSVYSFGEFGAGTRGVSTRKRREVRRAVGTAVEDLVAQYTTADWSLAALGALRDAPPTLPPTQREVIYIKVADVLEDHLDQGLQYIPAKKLISDTDNQVWTAALLELAREVGAVEIATELQTLSEESLERHVPEYLVNARSGSIVVAPRSHRERVASRLTRKISRWLAKKNNVAGRRAA
jgi:(p)ppGpp synthase/HD superfamily hydrolase